MWKFWTILGVLCGGCFIAGRAFERNKDERPVLQFSKVEAVGDDRPTPVSITTEADLEPARNGMGIIFMRGVVMQANKGDGFELHLFWPNLADKRDNPEPVLIKPGETKTIQLR